MSQAMTADYTDHKKNADYIYINDPQFHLMYGEYVTISQCRLCITQIAHLSIHT